MEKWWVCGRRQFGAITRFARPAEAARVGSAHRRKHRHGYLPLDLRLVIGEEGCMHKQLLPQDVALSAISHRDAHAEPSAPNFDFCIISAAQILELLRLLRRPGA
jgi:hypothetical protein